MKKFAPLFLAAALIAGGAAEANAWERSGGGTTNAGKTWKSTGQGSCSGGVCTSQQQLTGPNGRTITRNGSLYCQKGTSTTPGKCTSSRKVTGTYGRGFTRNGTISRY